MKKILLIILFLTVSVNILILQAQKKFGGVPPSWTVQKTLLKSDNNLKSHIIENPFTVEQMLQDEKLSDDMPERVGINLATNLSLSRDGEWETLSTGETICRLKIVSRGADAILLYYSKFELPQGAKLFIYNSDHSHLLGAYTHETNPEGGIFTTEFVAGDSLILEYVAPVSKIEPAVEIEQLCYGYKNIKISTYSDADNETSCMVDVVCSEGIDWQNEKDGVVKMIVPIGTNSYICSATLLNNTAEDFRPYIYTAFHCIESSTSQATSNELKRAIFYFNHEATTCGGNDVKESITQIGCLLLEGKSLSTPEGLDQVLLLLCNQISSDNRPYFNGWDITSVAPRSGVCIHHPKGEVKKISTYITPAKSETWITSSVTGGVNAHWSVNFTRTANGFSSTERGSSGSPLFNQSKCVVGSLTGGNSSCRYPEGRNLYGKLERFWDYISVYLDPMGKGVTTLSGKRKPNSPPSPQNLSASWKNNATEVQLKWAAVKQTPTNYIVYRNGEIVGHPTTTQFAEKDLYPGKHIYQVSAYYSDITTETTKSSPAILEKYPASYPQIEEVKRVGENSVSLSWTTLPQSQTIFWGSNNYGNIVPIQGELPIYLGQKWGESDIKPIVGSIIASVETYCFAQTNYTLYIKQGNNIYTQNIPANDKDGDLTIKLDKGFNIGGDEPLYCMMRINNAPAINVCTDDLNVVYDRGAVFSNNGYDFSPLDIPHNIYMKLNVLQNNLSELTTPSYDKIMVSSSIPVSFINPLGYKIYRNGEMIESDTKEMSYVDKNATKGTEIQYSVEALYPNNEILKSLPYTYPLSSESYYAQIESVEVNGAELDVDDNGEYNYLAYCPDNTANIIVEAVENGNVSINGENGNIYSKDISTGGKFTLPIKIVSESGENMTEYQLNLYKLPADIIIKRWGDVLAVVNNPENNGGLSFVKFKWYRDGVELSDTAPYIEIDDANGSYYSVQLQTEEGVLLQSCEQKFSTITDNIYLYPAIIEKGGSLNISIPDSNNGVVKASISDMMGQTQPITLQTGANVIIAPGVAGTYILNILLSDGANKSVKFIVK